jgi:transposase
VHKRSVTACVLTPGDGAEPRKEVRTFSTMTADLLALAAWLAEAGVTHVAMESTGVYWKPVWNLLEDQFTLVLVNAAHIKAVPGRKTDVGDAEWLAQLLRHGLLQPSFVPDRDQRELRELTRYRTSLVRARSAEVNRLHKTLEGANIKLGNVVSDLSGVSARQMLEQLVAGNADTAELAQLACGAMRKKITQIEQALQGRLSAHQRFMITQHLAAIDGFDAQIAAVQGEIDARIAPFAAELAGLESVPGIGPRIAVVLLAEIGTDMSRFPSAAHLASWAGMCPGHDESAGKRRSGRTRKGSVWLRTALVEAAQAAGRSKDTALGARYRRLTARRGKKKAAVAVGRLILKLAYHLLSTGELYADEYARSVVQGDREREQRRLVRRLEAMGHHVTLSPAA